MPAIRRSVSPLVASLVALPVWACGGESSSAPLRVARPAQDDGSPTGVYTDTPLLDVAGEVVAAPPTPDWDTALALPAPEAYAATRYELRAPGSLASAFAALTMSDPALRVFTVVIAAEPSGLRVRYGAADRAPDGVLAWQDPDLQLDFRAAQAESAGGALVSEPFRYGLRARVASGLSGTGAYTLALDAERAIWTATRSDDGSRLEDGALYGLVSRSEAEARALSLGGLCPAVCGLTSGACTGAGVRTLAEVFDCTETPLDADLDGDGAADAYRLVIGFTAERTELVSLTP